jgi:hypothetical protein
MSNVKQFALDINKFCTKTKEQLDQACRKTVLEIGASLVQKSPVGNPDLWKRPAPKGYVGGRFRGNWAVGINNIPTTVFDIIDKSGAASIQRITEGAQQGKRGDVFYIANSLPYAEELEDGHSKTQAPNGIVGPTVAEFERFIAKAVHEVKS